MASLKELQAERRQKLAVLQAAGIDSYPALTKRTHSLVDVISNFSSLMATGESIIVAGRVRALRQQGAIAFLDLDDGSGSLQGLIQKKTLADEALKLFNSTVDVGDFLELTGKLTLTKRGEPTIVTKSWRMLTKSLRPLPDKWHGLKDVEERFRRRYLDILMSPEVKERLTHRSQLVAEIRKFYNAAGYLEVETPRLQSLPGGATARPFVTHHHALDVDFYLSIAQELYLKELLIGGFTKVYEIGRKFRNEGIDATHNPEFTMLESNEAYGSAASQREFVEKLFRAVIQSLFGQSEFKYAGETINIAPAFAVVKFYDLLEQTAKLINPAQTTRAAAAQFAAAQGIEVLAHESLEKILDHIYKKKCRSTLIQPTFVVDYPAASNPFAKRLTTNPLLIDRFQLVIGGLELVNAFSELNNPIDQRERYQSEDAKRQAGEIDISPSDENYLEAMEYGMPPNGGIGIGIDRFAMLITDTDNIKEVIFFPTLRPK